MATATTYDPIQTAFQSAVQDFQKNLSNKKLYADILKTRSIDEVYDATDALQAKPGHLRHLSKIEPFLLSMKEYAGVIEQFVQAKPDVLALIWAPIKLLLQWTSVLKQAFDAVINTIAEVGNRLPEFQRVVKLFTNSSRVQDLLLLFFKDILDFYTVALNFFSLSRWNYFFESLWPRHREKINVVIKNIDKHTLLMRDEVRLEHIQEEHEARLRSLQHFDSTEKEQRRQAYRSIRTDVSPKDFGRELDRLQAIMCEGTDEWLMQNSTFKQWLSCFNPSMQWLWLHGIPGAGKTILASAVVDAVKSKGSVAFAFLTYRQSEQMEPLDIVLAMIFQLSADSERIQEVVCQSFVQSTRSSLKDATRVLGEVINCSGPTYLVVDGLDEIESSNVNRLLSSLQDVSDQCPEAKILVSSRSDHLIQQKLQKRAALRADQNNLETIKIFVSVKSQEWLVEQGFPQDIRAEIENLLMPVADKSKGMFLYAKLILENIAMLDHVDEIRAELRVLPEELHDVYQRALDRVNCLKPEFLKQKAQKILGWTACTPTPMTIQELEQAILVDTDDLENLKAVSTALNVVKICGPIIEIVDEYVTLVHFSFREYLLSPKVVGSIKPADAVRDLSLCCLAYLSQKPHNDSIDDQSMEENILAGAYRLSRYATIHWLDIVDMHFRLRGSAAIDDAIIHRLHKFKELRAQDFASDEPDTLYFSRLRALRTDHQALYHWLCAIRHFQNLYSRSGMRRPSMKLKRQNADPTTLSNTSHRIYQIVDSLLCGSAEHHDCQCSRIRMHLGANPFKCSESFCPYYSRGFGSRMDLESHLQAHTEIWTCRVKDCTASTEYFLSSRMRDMHESIYHGETTSSAWSHQSLQGQVSNNEIGELLQDAIISNNITLVKQLADHLAATKMSSGPYIYFNKKVMGSASLEMVQELMNNPRIHTNISNCIRVAESSKNKAMLAALLRTTSESENILRDFYLPQVISAILRVDPTHFEKEVNAFLQVKESNVYTLIEPRVIAATRHSESALETLIRWWKASMVLTLVRETKGGSPLSAALVVVSRCSPHRELAELLLEEKANLSGIGRSISPLQWAARWKTKSAAELMVYLLEKGADPLPKYKGVKVCEEPGAKNIQKWTGKTWQQHVDETESARPNLNKSKGLVQSSYMRPSDDPNVEFGIDDMDMTFSSMDAGDVLENFNFDSYIEDPPQEFNIQGLDFGAFGAAGVGNGDFQI